MGARANLHNRQRVAIESAIQMHKHLCQLISDAVYRHEELGRENAPKELMNQLDQYMHDGWFASYRIEFEEALK